MNHLMICRAIARARRLTLCLLVFLVPATQTPSPARADTAVDVLLVLAADISRSLDERKFRLQREGYAEAITSPRVIRAIESGPNGRIAVCLVEWSGPLAQAVVVDWTVVANAVDARRLAERIREAPRLFMDRTAIGNAIDFSTRLFDKAPATSTRRVIDVSGDGTSNAGRSVLAARDDALTRGSRSTDWRYSRRHHCRATRGTRTRPAACSRGTRTTSSAAPAPLRWPRKASKPSARRSLRSSSRRSRRTAIPRECPERDDDTSRCIEAGRMSDTSQLFDRCRNSHRIPTDEHADEIVQHRAALTFDRRR